jgi:Uncharacterized conserved protein
MKRTTKIRRITLPLIAAGALAAFLAACAQPSFLLGSTSASSTTASATAASTETVTIRIASASSSAKTITAATPTIAYYELLYGASGSTQKSLGSWSSLTNAVVSVPIGTFDFVLDAYDSSDNLVLEGSLSSQSITASSTLEFTLSPLTSGTGSVNVTLKWPSSLGIASVTTTYAGSEVSPALSIAADSSSSTSSVTYANSSAAAGNYKLAFKLYNSAGAMQYSATELVKVRKNLVSSATLYLLAPTAPSGLKASDGGYSSSTGYETANLSWTDNSDSETEFVVEYSDDTTTWSTLATLSANVTSCSDTAVSTSATRYYRVLAKNSYGASEASSVYAFNPASAKDITAFSFASPAATGSISGTTILVTVPDGTDLSALVATYTMTGSSVAVGSTAQESGTTANDFRYKALYTVTASDSSTKTYTVFVARSSDSYSSNIGILRYVAGGTFQRDSTSTHTSTVADLLMGATEITRAQFTAVTGLSDPSDTSRSPGSNYPAQNLSWYQCLVFCNDLSILEGLTPVYSINGSTTPSAWGTLPTSENATWNAVTASATATGYRLPREMEYMWASMGGASDSRSADLVGGVNVGGYTKTFSGYNGSNARNDYAWSGSNSGGTTHPGASLKPNELFIYDMSGNVWERMWDWYGGYPSGAVTNYTGPSSGGAKSTRGGGWYLYGEDNYYPAFRGCDTVMTQHPDMGLRVVRGIASSTSSGVSATVSMLDSSSLTITANSSVAKGTSYAASVASGYASYAWSLDGDTQSSQTTSSASFDTSSLSTGVHHIAVIATTAAGDALSGSLAFSVN